MTMIDSRHIPPVILAWPHLLTTEMAAQFLSVDKELFGPLMARMKIAPIDVGDSSGRWARRYLERAVTRLPKLDTSLGLSSNAPTITMDKILIERIAAAVSAQLGAHSHSRVPELVSLREAGKALGIGRSTIYRLINQGKLDVQRIGRRTLVPRSEVERIQVEGTK